MENKNLTAVDWLHVEFQKRFPKETAEMYNNNQLLYEQMIEQAKEKEKEQLLSFAKLYDDDLSEGKIRSREDLYKETYGK